MNRPSTHLVELPGFRVGVRSGSATRCGRDRPSGQRRPLRGVRELEGVMKEPRRVL